MTVAPQSLVYMDVGRLVSNYHSGGNETQTISVKKNKLKTSFKNLKILEVVAYTALFARPSTHYILILKNL